jgi:hypothetical protein
VVVLLFFVGAWIFVRQDGRRLLPKTHPNHEPHAGLTVPGPQRRA